MKKPTTGHKPPRGIIGAGGIAVNHADGVKAHGGAQVVAVADSSAERCRAMADTYQIPKIYTDFRKLVADPEIDAVIVGLPNYLHLPVSLAALSAGKHVLLEKPIAMNYSEAQQIVNAARKHKRPYAGNEHALNKSPDHQDAGSTANWVKFTKLGLLVA